MSEPRLIEPLLSDCMMGDPISDRCGVRCCPAMHNQTEEKYIVKILSIPASRKQLAALVLSGACKDAADAQRYFKELADEAVAEAELLQKLSRLEGFRAYDAWQIEPMEDGSGFDVYLRASYGKTLERHMRRNTLTHLAAVNLGLDLCAALSVCRRNGWLYVDLKPENIYLSDTQGYLIGDLGFIRLSSLKYASLPDKYRSEYTAPEIEDAYSALNSTLDVYAVGLILYQVYNNGQLPAADEPMTPPEYADYEMAEIILKACADDPADRWLDPQEMAQALVSYMQRNTVNDDPIIPPAVPAEPELSKDEPELTEEYPELVEEDPGTIEESPEIVEENAESAPADPEITEEAPSAEEEGPEHPTEETLAEETPDVEEPTEEVPDEEPVLEETTEETEVESTPVEETPAAEPETEPEEDEEPEQIAIAGFLFDDFIPDDDELAELEETAISDEVNQMLVLADELIAHKAPDPVVAPEAIEVPMPEPILPDPPEEAPAAETSAETTADESEPSVPAEAYTEEDEVAPEEPRRRRKWGWLIAVLLLALLLGVGGMYAKEYYENTYLQHVNGVTLESAEDWLTVILDTDIDNSLLTVVCTDTYGNRLTQSVSNNRATFTSLPSGMTYKITVTISGRHQLTGNTTASYTTPTQTSIIGLNGVIGDTDGSVILSFSVQGPDASGWLVKYSAEGEAEQTAVCTGHMAMITGLTPGKTYSFRLVPQEDLYVISGDTLEFTASKVAYAENLTIHGFEGGSLIVTWDPREGMAVDSWTVRCYNNAGTDLTLATTETEIAIMDLDVSQGYTVEVTATGMTVNRVANISANSVSFKDIILDDSVPGQLSVSWNFEGTAPEGGWTVVYTVNDGAPVTVTCQQNNLILTDLIPGAHYTFDISLPSGTMYFGATSATWDSPVATAFYGYGVGPENMVFYLCLAPEVDDWSWDEVPQEHFTSAFAATDSVGIVIQLLEEYETSDDLIVTTYIVRDTDGNVVSTARSEDNWTSMWYRGFCELNLPTLPAAPGTYTLEIYLNGSYITATPITFTVS